MIINLDNLTKAYKVKDKKGGIRDILFPKYQDVFAVKDISFSIEKGESVALVGPNGAGKTTIMKMLSGLLFPTGGAVSVLEFNPFDKEKEFLKKIGLVMGNKSGLAWDLTPSQNFQLFRQLYRIPEEKFKKRLKDLTEMLSVDKHIDKPVRKLSLGERMKLELVASILHDPDVLFLDEPTIGLDILSKQKIRNFLREIQRESEVTIILTSHDMDDVERVTDRVIIINEGTKVFDDSMEALLGRYKSKKYLTLLFTEKVDQKEIAKYGKIIEKKSLSYTLEIAAKDQPQTITELMQKFPVDDIDIIHVPLEEIIGDMFVNRTS
jgi:ABC-2 type transport system ATP-binding protein